MAPEYAPGPDFSDAARELQSLLREEVSKVDERRMNLERAMELLATATRSGGATASFVPLPTEIMASIVQQVSHAEPTDVRMVVLDQGLVIGDDLLSINEEWIKAGGTQRGIYPADLHQWPRTEAWQRGQASIGEVQRVLPTVPTEFVVVGEDAMISLAEWGRPGSGYVLSWDKRVIAVHIALFEELWQRARPVEGSLTRKGGDEQLLELLGMGLKDEAIGRIMGLSQRTIARRIAGLHDEYGVDTRFQLGLAVAAARSR